MKRNIVGPKFEHLTHEYVEALLQNPNPQGFDLEASEEINRLVSGYFENFEVLCERLGRIPDKILAFKAKTPIEEAARNLFKRILAEEIDFRNLRRTNAQATFLRQRI